MSDEERKRNPGAPRLQVCTYRGYKVKSEAQPQVAERWATAVACRVLILAQCCLARAHA